MSAESHSHETSNPARPVSLVDFEDYLGRHPVTKFGEAIDQANFDREDFEVRTKLSLTMADHVHEQIEDTNTAQAHNYRGQYATLPKTLVEYCIRDLLRVAEVSRDSAKDLYRQYIPIVHQERNKYLQIVKVIQLGRELEAENNAMSCCATDVLIGYGMAIRITEQEKGRRS